jgi:hypothetical protein
MSEVVALLRAAIEKQKKRFFLSQVEKEFIKDIEAMLEKEEIFELNLISNIRLKLNSLVDHFKSSGKHPSILEDLIVVILQSKIEITKEVFGDIDLEHIQNLINERQFSEANNSLASIFERVSQKEFTSQEELDQWTVIWNKLFADEDDPSSAIVIVSPGTTASLAM